ncbi:MAG TPA: response regulator transcription factor [Opitutus sp.]|nr:response regulator transcription factor [Opitutus sp.]
MLFADDHLVVRQQLKRLLAKEPGWQVIGEADDGIEAVRLVSALKPDVVVTDLALPGLHGLEVIQRVHRQSSSIRIVVVSIHADEQYVRQALSNGAMAFVSKDEVGQHLLPAIRATLAGKRYPSPSLRQLSDAEFDALERKGSGQSHSDFPGSPDRPD